MRFFVTGAGGFIGSHVVEQLLTEGHDVAALRRPGSNSLRLRSLPLHYVDVVGQDGAMTDRELSSLRDFSPEVFIHMGWIGVGNAARNDIEQLDNLSMTSNLLQAANAAGVRHFVGLGSQAEYGPCEGAISELQPIKPTTLYGAAKAASAILTEALAQKLGMEFSWVRVFSTYGPGDEPYWMVQQVARALLVGESPDLTLGTQRWDYLYVGDAARAVAAVAQARKGTGVVNLGSGTAIELKEIVSTLRDIASPGAELSFGAIPFREDQVMHLQADVRKLSQATGWLPEVSLHDGLSRTVAALKESMEIDANE